MTQSVTRNIVPCTLIFPDPSPNFHAEHSTIIFVAYFELFCVCTSRIALSCFPHVTFFLSLLFLFSPRMHLTHLDIIALLTLLLSSFPSDLCSHKLYSVSFYSFLHCYATINFSDTLSKGLVKSQYWWCWLVVPFYSSIYPVERLNDYYQLSSGAFWNIPGAQFGGTTYATQLVSSLIGDFAPLLRAPLLYSLILPRHLVTDRAPVIPLNLIDHIPLVHFDVLRIIVVLFCRSSLSVPSSQSIFEASSIAYFCTYSLCTFNGAVSSLCLTPISLSLCKVYLLLYAYYWRSISHANFALSSRRSTGCFTISTTFIYSVDSLSYDANNSCSEH
ncbi:unnamed protein product [Dicrocoelium dendriticum]|nr:unnamed protein product [Dicrocoelium dendriticum]